MPKTNRCLLAAALALGWHAPSLHAQENVNGVSLNTTTGAPSVTDGLTYDNTIEAVTDITSDAGSSYTVISSAPNALVQRNGTPNQSSVWYTINSSTSDLAGVNQTTYPALLRSNNLLEGADNVFANGTGASSGNIERLDYTWNVPFSNLNRLAFAVFERGNVGAHDAFTIAIVTGVDVNGTPTSYGGFLHVAAGWGGATNLQGNPTNQLLRYSNGDNLTALTNRSTLNSDQNTQGVGGVVFKVSSFGLPAGTTVYGYSLMDNDVTPTTANDLLDVTNTSVFPANSGNGGTPEVDLAAINGLGFQEVPEPSAWTLLCIGGLVTVAWVRAGRRQSLRA